MDNLSISTKCIINQDMSIYDFIGQFQLSSSKLLCIINGTTLHYYEDHQIPTDICFSNKDGNKYYFIDNINMYCIFGEEAAKRFYPSIENELITDDKSSKSIKFKPLNMPRLSDKQTIAINNPIIKISTEQEPDKIIITDKGREFIFPNCKPILEIQNITD